MKKKPMEGQRRQVFKLSACAFMQPASFWLQAVSTVTCDWRLCWHLNVFGLKSLQTTVFSDNCDTMWDC